MKKGELPGEGKYIAGYGEGGRLRPEGGFVREWKRPREPFIDWHESYSRTHIALLDTINEKRYNKQLETNRKIKEHYPHILYVDKLVFKEKLYLYNKNEHKVGIFSISVNRMEHLTDLEVSVEAKTKLKKGHPNTSKLYSYSMIDLKYRTVYEMREEYEADHKQSLLRTVEWKKEPEYYRITSAFIDNNYRTIENENYYKAKALASVITEGAFIILLRQLAQTNFVGLLKFYVLFINGDLCLCNLTVHDIEAINYFQQPIFVKNVHKNIKCPNDKTQYSRILMTNVGQIIYQDWSDTDLFLMLDSHALLYKNEEPMLNPDNLVPLRYRFYENPELYAYYTDEYHKNLIKYKDYFNDHPDALHVISFFLKEILLKKPHRVCEFASNYFCELL